MEIVEPQVYCIAETKLNEGGLENWLTDNHWQECLDHISGSDSEKLIELAGRRCYKSFKIDGEKSNPNITKIRKNSEQYILNILKSGHGSVCEHASSTWAMENISRTTTHEIVRHKSGTAVSQESLRFCRIDKLAFWIPPEIEENAEAKELFIQTLLNLEESQKRLVSIFNINEIKNFGEKKKLTSSFRRIAPIGIATGIIMTFNMRALRWVIENRTTEHAEIEIRHVVNKIAEQAVLRWPMIFQDFKKQEVEYGPPVWTPQYHKV